MPTFCRHNRFLERCPICSKTLPGNAPAARSSGAASRRTRASASASRPQRAKRGERVSIRRQARAADDGYRCELLPGVHASVDAVRLADEIAFSAGRLLALEVRPPDLYSEVRTLAGVDLEQATWASFLIAYLCPLEGAEPFAGIRLALRSERAELADLADLPLGPRSSHEPARGAGTLHAYRHWAALSGSQAQAFAGDRSWSPQRRFERLFERLALPGLTRAARFELLVLLGALGLYDLRAGSLYFAGVRGADAQDPATLAAKRVFAIGDALLLERRAAALAEAISVPIAALELALANWGTGDRATLGFPPESSDREARQRALDALAL